jgi:hypothetical protein
VVVAAGAVEQLNAGVFEPGPGQTWQQGSGLRTGGMIAAGGLVVDQPVQAPLWVP